MRESSATGTAWLLFSATTVLFWGLYGVFLHTGQMTMDDPVHGRYKAFLIVGIAYFITAVVAPLVLLWTLEANWSYPVRGIGWSLAAGMVGPVSYPCPARPGVLHVMESEFIAEIIDPQTDLPVAPGAEGELVLTNLGRAASPLLRYRTEDRVRPSRDPCDCGRNDLRLEGGILSRVDDMLVVRG